MLPIKTILVPTDFSRPAEAALRLALPLAHEHGARVLAVHVAMLPPLPLAYGEMLPPTLPVENTRERLLEALNRLTAEVLEGREVHVETRLTEGDPAREILRLAEEEGADMIVIGTHGRTGLERLLMGSVAEQVLRKANCPVLAVKGPLAAKASAPRKLETATV